MAIDPSTAELLKLREHYSALISKRPAIELKGAKMLYTSVNGHMFFFSRSYRCHELALTFR